ncbi:protein SLX4IP isoform X3 [Prinia subflava]|uniref:protein SLX4IP isoform X3 n=1 Tax=Prinia subflava TaxID=208062 RepID=UPI002FE1A039
MAQESDQPCVFISSHRDVEEEAFELDQSSGPGIISVGTLLSWWMFIFCLKVPVKTPAGFQIMRKRRSASCWKRLLLQGSNTTWRHLNTVVSGNPWNMDQLGLCFLPKEELSSGTSEYFTESAENKKLKISLSEQIKQDILRKIVKRTKPRRSSASKPQISKDSKKVYLGSADLQTENRENDRQTALGARADVKRRSPGLLKDCTNTAESSLELPGLEQRNDGNQRQPDDVRSQQKPHSLEWLEASLRSENPPRSSESALPAPKQSQRVTKTQAQLRTCASEEKLEHFTNVSSEGAPLTSTNTETSKGDDKYLGPFLEKTPLNSRLFSEQDIAKTLVDKKSLTLRKDPSWSLFVSNSEVQTGQNEPSTATEELPAVPTSCLELHPVSSEKLSQKRKKEVENGLGRLKLRRLKKSKSEILP